MKRKDERGYINSTEVIKLPDLPYEVLLVILKGLNERAVSNFRRTAKFFSEDKQARETHFQKIIEKCLDYSDVQELEYFRNIPNLINHFTAELQKVNTIISVALADLQEPIALGGVGCSVTVEEPVALSLDSEESEYLEYSDEEESISSVLLAACQHGYIQNLQLLLNRLKDCKTLSILPYINGKAPLENQTPLSYAAAYGRKQIFSLLIENNASLVFGEIDFDTEDHLVDYDLGYNFIEAVTPLHIIALRSDINWLLDIFQRYPLALTDLFTKEYKNHLQLIVENDHENLRLLLEQDSSIVEQEDAAHWTLLNWACCFNHLKCLDLLIKYKADVNATIDWGINSLHLACAVGNLEIIKHLVANGARATTTLNENSCLHLTAYHGFTECTKYLIDELNLDIEATNAMEHSPLYLANLKTDAFGNPLSPEKLAKKTECAILLKNNNDTTSDSTFEMSF